MLEIPDVARSSFAAIPENQPLISWPQWFVPLAHLHQKQKLRLSRPHYFQAHENKQRYPVGRKLV
jgi:hypothetical protein